MKNSDRMQILFYEILQKHTTHIFAKTQIKLQELI